MGGKRPCEKHILDGDHFMQQLSKQECETGVQWQEKKCSGCLLSNLQPVERWKAKQDLSQSLWDYLWGAVWVITVLHPFK